MHDRPTHTPDIGGTLARVQSRSTTWLALLLPPTLAYLFGAFKVVRGGYGPSGLLGLIQNSAEAVLLDLCVVMTPLIVAITLYVRHLNHKAASKRRTFVTAHSESRLVRTRQSASLIYRVDGHQMQVVWNADGIVTNGKHYRLPDEAQLLPLNTARFIANGTP